MLTLYIKIICKIRSPRAYVRTQNFAREVPKRIDILGLGPLDCKNYIFLNYTQRNVVEFFRFKRKYSLHFPS